MVTVPKYLIIPAAGKGTRMLQQGSDVPKCLLQVGRSTILCRLLDQANDLSIRQVAVVVGHLAGQVVAEIERHRRRWLFDHIEIIHNTRYESTNNVMSIALCRPYLTQDVLIVDSDLILENLVLNSFVERASRSSLLVDARKQHETIDMKVHVCDGRVQALGKHLGSRPGIAEFFGVSRFLQEGAVKLAEKVGELVESGREDAWYDEAIELVAQGTEISAVSLEQASWWEIDTQADYDAVPGLNWL
jgi:choline kinase